jgi:hypothetical protein
MSQLLNRSAFIGGSDARVIMGDDEASLIRLWREKRGEVAPEDLSHNLAVQLGSVTEELNRRWYERNTGHIVKDVQRRIQHPLNKWMAATLDGLVKQTAAVFEAKFMLPWSFSEEEAAEKHMAQLQLNMWRPCQKTAYSMQKALEKAGIQFIANNGAGTPGALAEMNRDRGTPHDVAPPTPPYVRVRIRRFGEFCGLLVMREGRPSAANDAFGNAMTRAGLLLIRHGPCGLPAVGAARATSAPRLINCVNLVRPRFHC